MNFYIRAGKAIKPVGKPLSKDIEEKIKKRLYSVEELASIYKNTILRNEENSNSYVIADSTICFCASVFFAYDFIKDSFNILISIVISILIFLLFLIIIFYIHRISRFKFLKLIKKYYKDDYDSIASISLTNNENDLKGYYKKNADNSDSISFPKKKNHHDENYKKEIVAYITLAFSYCSIMILTLVILKTNFKDLYISLLFLIYLVLFFYFLISKVIFYKKPLKREQLIDQFVEAYFDENTAPVHISILLINIKNELLNNHTYKSDKRFITDGKLDFIENKIIEELKNNNLAKAIVNLYNYINFNGNLSQGYIVNQKLLEDWQKYYEDGIICEEEKNKIMSLVNIIDCYLKELKTNGGSK